MWSRIEDTVPHHPKLVQAGPVASWLWICSLVYANRLLTDGKIDTRALPTLGAISHPERAAKRLVACGLWHVVPGGFQIHDFHDFNPHAEDIKRKREQDRIRKESARNPSGRRVESARNPVGQTAVSARNPRASRARDPLPLPIPIKNKKKEQAASAVRGNQNSTAQPHALPKAAADAAARQESQTTQTDNGNGKANGNGNGHPATTTQAARLVFKGQRFVVFPWMLDKFSQILGPTHLRAFDLPAWYRVLDNRLSTENRVLTADERWPMLQQELKAEVERRGLPMIRAEKPFTHAELTKAARVRKLRFGCPHPETCDGEERCKARLILEWRQDARHDARTMRGREGES